MVPAGTVLTYQAQDTSHGYFTDSNDILGIIQQNLLGSNVVMRDNNIQTSFAAQINSILTGSVPFQFTATIQTNVDFASVGDIQAVMDHALYMACDQMPVSSIPNVTLPAGTQMPTGQPSQTGAGSAGAKVARVCGDPSWGFFDDPGAWLGCALQNTTNTLMVLVVGAAIAVVLIIAGQKKGVL